MNESECWQTAIQLIANGETRRAIELCEKEPCASSLECQRYLGWAYYQQDDFEKALSWFTKAASQGDGEALFGIGSVHFVQRDFPLALQYFERSVEHEYSRACGWIGYMYHQGLGVSKDVNKAIGYYKQAAARGYLIAERALIHLTWQRGNVFRKVFILPRYLYIIAKAAVIGYHDINDPRIADVPNALGRSKN